MTPRPAQGSLPPMPGRAIPLATHAATHLAFAAAFACACYAVGRALTLRVAHASRVERVGVAVALGAGVLSHLAMLLGLAGVLTRGATLAALGALLLALAPRLREVARELSGELRALRGGGAWAALLAGALVAAPIVVLALYPPYGWDATEYYLAAARRAVEEHAVRPQPFLRFPVYTQVVHMHFALALLFQDAVAAQLTQVVVLAALAAVTAALAIRLAGARAGLWAAALLLGNGQLLWVSVQAYADAGATLFFAAAALAASAWGTSGERRWAVLAGAFAGFAVGTKYTIVVPAVALCAAFAAVALRRGRAGDLLACAAAAVALGIPWYAYNLAHTGNPFFPLAASVFGTGPFSADDVRRLLSDVGRARTGGWDLLRAPWDVAFDAGAFHREGAFSKLLFFALPAIAIAGRRDRRLLALGAACVALTLWWFFSAPLLRYLVPVLPLSSAAAGAALATLAARGPLASRAVTLAAAVAFAWPGLRWCVRDARARGPLPVTDAARDAWIAARHPPYRAVKFLNDRHGAGWRAYGLMTEDVHFFARGTLMGDWFGPARYARVLDKLDRPDALAAELRAMGAGHLVVNTGRIGFACDAACGERFEQVFAEDGQLVLALREPR